MYTSDITDIYIYVYMIYICIYDIYVYMIYMIYRYIRSLSRLLASLPDPSLSQGQVEELEAVPVARKQGVIPEASNGTLQAFSYSERKLYKQVFLYSFHGIPVKPIYGM